MKCYLALAFNFRGSDEDKSAFAKMIKEIESVFGEHRDLKTLSQRELMALYYLIKMPRSRVKDMAEVFLPHLKNQITVVGTSSESGGWRNMGKDLHHLRDLGFAVQHEDGSWSATDRTPCEHEWEDIKEPRFVLSTGRLRVYCQCKVCGKKESWARKLHWNLCVYLRNKYRQEHGLPLIGEDSYA